MMGGFLVALLRDDSGQDATEYVLLVVLIALAVTAGMIALAGGINSGFNNASQSLNTQSGS
jgi:Flp pilus assembly pilin Flp